MRQGTTRLRCFLLRHNRGDPTPRALGAHLTVSQSGNGVSEATNAVQAPVIFV